MVLGESNKKSILPPNVGEIQRILVDSLLHAKMVLKRVHRPRVHLVEPPKAQAFKQVHGIALPHRENGTSDGGFSAVETGLLRHSTRWASAPRSADRKVNALKF